MDYVGSVYLYLNSPTHAETWVRGGEVPIFPAQKYKTDYRDGIFTPDENLYQKITGNVHRLAHEEDGHISIGKFIKFPVGRVESIELSNCEYYDEKTNTIVKLDGYAKSLGFDSHILCFSDLLSKNLMLRLGKICVVKICNVNILNSYISEQIGEKGMVGKVNYTSGLNRNLFLKSEQDQWQSEVRMAWPFMGPNPLYVKVPPETAKHVNIE